MQAQERSRRPARTVFGGKELVTELAPRRLDGRRPKGGSTKRRIACQAMEGEVSIKTLGIDHIHINVRNVKKFRDVMGDLFDADITPVAHWQTLDTYTSVVQVADAGQPFLDLLQAASDESLVAQQIKERGQGVSYISFRVENIEAAAAHAAKCGLHEVSRFGFPGMRQVQFHTVEIFGFMLELVEYDPDFGEHLVEIKRRLSEGETVEGMRYVESKIGR